MYIAKRRDMLQGHKVHDADIVGIHQHFIFLAYIENSLFLLLVDMKVNYFTLSIMFLKKNTL